MIVKYLKENKVDKIGRLNKIIQTENNRISQNCNDILEFAHQENILSSTNEDVVDIHQILKEVQQSFLSSNSKRLKIKLDLQANNSKIKGKESLLFNVFSNLLDNAIKYSEKSPEIIISTKNDKQNIFISIKDNGIGIEKNKKDLIFDKFYRIQNGDVHNVKGFGLGLSYVKLIIEKMNGEITLESELKKGSTFTIKIPIVNE